MIRTILVPIDFSDASTAALLRAEELARLTGASVMLVHVRDEFPFVSDEGTGFIPSALAGQHTAAQAQVGSLAAAVVARGVPARGVMVLGDARQRIVDLAEQEQVDLIVMGTHGRRGLPRLMLGSVAQQVARSSGVPVMIVRTDAEEQTQASFQERLPSSPGPRPPPVILVATDLEASSAAAVSCAFELARELGAKVHVLHVYAPPAGLSGDEVLRDARVASLHARTTRRVEEVAQHHGPAHASQCVAAMGEPSARILQTSLQLGADLIVVGTHGRSGIEHLCLGSVAEKVLREATCPVVVAKASDRAHGHFTRQSAAAGRDEGQQLNTRR